MPLTYKNAKIQKKIYNNYLLHLLPLILISTKFRAKASRIAIVSTSQPSINDLVGCQLSQYMRTFFDKKC